AKRSASASRPTLFPSERLQHASRARRTEQCCLRRDGLGGQLVARVKRVNEEWRRFLALWPRYLLPSCRLEAARRVANCRWLDSHRRRKAPCPACCMASARTA